MSESADHDEIPFTTQAEQATSTEVLIQGSAGQLVNLTQFLFGGLFALAFAYLAFVGPSYMPQQGNSVMADYLVYGIVVIEGLIGLYLGYRYLVARMDRFWVTRERLKQRVGVLNFKRKNLELYRVKDIEVREPLIYRLFGAGDVILVSSDRSDPLVRLTAIGEPALTADRLRDLVEKARRDFGVREID